MQRFRGSVQRFLGVIKPELGLGNAELECSCVYVKGILGFGSKEEQYVWIHMHTRTLHLRIP